MSLIKITNIIFFTSLFFVNSVNAANNIKIENPWSPEAPPVAKVMAGYMTIKNTSNKNITIKSAKSELFKRVEIHLTDMSDGMMRMIKQDNLIIKAKEQLELKPGGLHMMLIGKLKDIQTGSIIPVTLILNNNTTINIKIKVKADNEAETMHHHHH